MCTNRAPGGLRDRIENCSKRGTSRQLPFCALKEERRGGDSNPRYGFTRTHAFQACTFSHSDTSPNSDARLGARRAVIYYREKSSRGKIRAGRTDPAAIGERSSLLLRERFQCVPRALIVGIDPHDLLILADGFR